MTTTNVTGTEDFRRPASSAWVPRVSVSLLAELYEEFFERRTASSAQELVDGPNGLRGRADPEEVRDACVRLVALSNFTQTEECRGWLLSRGKDGIWLREPAAFQRAAARAPLRKVANFLRHQFQPDGFVGLVLAETPAQGSA